MHPYYWSVLSALPVYATTGLLSRARYWYRLASKAA